MGDAEESSYPDRCISLSTLMECVSESGYNAHEVSASEMLFSVAEVLIPMDHPDYVELMISVGTSVLESEHVPVTVVLRFEDQLKELLKSHPESADSINECLESGGEVESAYIRAFEDNFDPEKFLDSRDEFWLPSFIEAVSPLRWSLQSTESVMFIEQAWKFFKAEYPAHMEPLLSHFVKNEHTPAAIRDEAEIDLQWLDASKT